MSTPRRLIDRVSSADRALDARVYVGRANGWKFGEIALVLGISCIEAAIRDHRMDRWIAAQGYIDGFVAGRHELVIGAARALGNQWWPWWCTFPPGYFGEATP